MEINHMNGQAFGVIINQGNPLTPRKDEVFAQALAAAHNIPEGDRAGIKSFADIWVYLRHHQRESKAAHHTLDVSKEGWLVNCDGFLMVAAPGTRVELPASEEELAAAKAASVVTPKMQMMIDTLRRNRIPVSEPATVDYHTVH